MSAKVIRMAPRQTRRRSGKKAPVIMGPTGGGKRLDSALAFMNAAMANSETTGILVAVVERGKDGIVSTETRMFGAVSRHPVAFIGSAITQAAMDDSFWE